MTVEQLGAETQARTGFTHKFTIDYTDLTALGAATAGTVSLAAYTAGTLLAAAATRLETPFDGGSTSALALIVGWDGASTDDDDGAIEAREVHADASYVSYGDATGVAFATKRTGYAALDAGTWKAKFTATGANLNTLTTGEVHIYLQLIDLTKI